MKIICLLFYVHNKSEPLPQKGSGLQAVYGADMTRLGTGEIPLDKKGC